MADFCKQCGIDTFGEDGRDLAGLVTREQSEQGYAMLAVCEGCGVTWVNHDGECIGECGKAGQPGHGKVVPRCTRCGGDGYDPDQPIAHPDFGPAACEKCEGTGNDEHQREGD